ncbi:chromate transporter [bacterium]|nr:chromate transporter [bacterium]
MKRVSLLEIFLLFVKVGSMIFGGGIVILPLLQSEAVEKRHWLTDEELVEFYSISQLIPGINAPDVSMFIGYKLRGKRGAITAGFGVITVPFLIIICIATALDFVIHIPLVKSALWGVEIGTIVILSNAIRIMWSKSITDIFTFIFFAIVFYITAFTQISPVWVVFTALALGVIKGFFDKSKVREEN